MSNTLPLEKTEFGESRYVWKSLTDFKEGERVGVYIIDETEEKLLFSTKFLTPTLNEIPREEPQNKILLLEPSPVVISTPKKEKPKILETLVYKPKLLVDISLDIERDVSKGVRVIFNTAVDRQSAEKAFSVTPLVPGDFSWNGKAMTWLPSSLEAGVSYSVSVDRGVLSQVGISNDTVTVKSFTAQASRKRLSVPYFHQEYDRSCEEAALRMALAYYGVKTNDLEILGKVGYSPRPWNMSENIWDDPHEQFVGFVHGTQSGYGTFRDPITRASRAFGRPAEAYTNISAQFLAKHISENYPVVVWGYNAYRPVRMFSWKTDQGKEIIAYQGEHVRVVVGMVGTKENPIGFYLHDPLYAGPNEYWRADQLIKHMNIFGELTNQAVVVR